MRWRVQIETLDDSGENVAYTPVGDPVPCSYKDISGSETESDATPYSETMAEFRIRWRQDVHAGMYLGLYDVEDNVTHYGIREVLDLTGDRRFLNIKAERIRVGG